jgi:acetylornithine deacetylase/succinyl-diaminopimelate desuccinylase-like protein
VEVGRRLAAAGLTPSRDAVGNVLARVGPSGDAVVVAAHLDTVFPAGTPVTPVRDGARLRAPGIGDNTVALAALLFLARSIAGARRPPTTPVLLAATVGEEGLGDLRGIRAVLDAGGVGCVVAVEGHGVDGLVTTGIASARLVAVYRGPGGHSWRDRARPSALHAMFAAATAATAVAGPASINVGVASGGTSVNTVAADARIEVDIRDPDDSVVDGAVARVTAALRATPPGIEVDVQLVGRRPGGRIGTDHPLVKAVVRARRAVGLPPPLLDAASTDANAAYPRRIPAVTVGLTRGGGTHRLDEWIELGPLVDGVGALAHLVHHLAGLPAPRGLV